MARSFKDAWQDFYIACVNEFRSQPVSWVIIITLIIIILIGLHFFHFPKPQRPGTPAVVAEAKKENVPIIFPALGIVTSLSNVTVRTQINGRLMEVYYKEGQIVKAGDLIALIDQRPYLAQQTQYQGQLARDQALLENAQKDLSRYQLLWKQNSVAKQILDTQASLVHQLEGTVRLDQGLLEAVKVNLYYTQITAPITGRIGLRLVDPGNFVDFH